MMLTSYSLHLFHIIAVFVSLKLTAMTGLDLGFENENDYQK